MSEKINYYHETDEEYGRRISAILAKQDTCEEGEENEFEEPLKKYMVSMIIETNAGRPSEWDWNDLIVTEAVEHVSHVMSHTIYPEYISATKVETNE